jgi:hypothetical protein
VRRVANAQIVLAAPVEVAAIPAEQGTAAAGFTTTANPRKTVAVSGRCTVGVASTRTVAAVKPVTGRALLGLTARGAAGRIKAVGGRCTVGFAATRRAIVGVGVFAGAPVYPSAWTGQETTMAPLPPSYPITVVCGQPLQVSLPITDSAGAPIAAGALTAARAQVRVEWGSNRVLHEWSTTAGNAAISTGTVTLTATTAETVNWQIQWPPTVVWDLQVVDTSGVVHRLTSAGPIRLYPAITR